jgi:transcriptional regulator with XRE-family HTH domain
MTTLVENSPYGAGMSATKRPSAQIGFGRRLAALRKARGMSQIGLADALGVKQPTVSYYESQDGTPQADVLTKLAKTLGVTIDELLGTPGHRRALPTDDPAAQRMWRKFQQLMELPEPDQKAVLHMLGGLIAMRGKGRRPARTTQTANT